MHANRNRAVLQRIGRGMMRANRTRNAFAVLAIILTTFMITTIFTIGINYVENMELSAVRSMGTAADVLLNNPTPEQSDQIESLDYVKTTGRQITAGSVTQRNSGGRALEIPLLYLDETAWESHYQGAINDISGRYPEAADEIMLSLNALEQLGISAPAQGMSIPITYADRNGEQTRTFALCGWFRTYTNGPGTALVSKQLCDDSDATLAESGVLSLTLENTPSDFYRLEDDVPIDEAAGQRFTTTFSLDAGSSGTVTVVVVLLALFIIGSGYLLIYNVLYISVTRDTRFYGLLKTIGTSPTQIKKLVRGQAARFACIGIPVGIVLAVAVSFGLIPSVLTSSYLSGNSSMDAEIFFHPLIFAASVLFSAATVWLSCNAPARAAARISPVEALRYQNFAPKKIKARRSRHGGRACVMAFHNVFRDQKRAVLVFLSLFLGTVTILGVNGMLDSMTGEAYVEKYLNYDFEYTDIHFQTAGNHGEETPQFDQQFVDQLAALEEVGETVVNRAVWVRLDLDDANIQKRLRAYYDQDHLAEQGGSFEQFVSVLRRYVEDGTYGCYVSTIDEQYVQAYNDAHPDSPVDLEAFRRGETAIVGLEGDNWSVNDALAGCTLTLAAAGGKTADFAIDASFKMSDYRQNALNGNREQIGNSVPNAFYVSQAGMARLTDTPVIYDIGINAAPGVDLEAFTRAVNQAGESLTGDAIVSQSALSTLQEWDQMYNSLSILGNGASILLILIGLINFVNVMLTSVIARRNELAILESVGMTKKQIMAMLTWEGGFYALISAGLILTLGNAFLYLVARAAPSIADYAQFVYPTGLVIGLIAAFTVICLAVPAVVFKAICGDTVIERLRNFEN